MKRIKFLTSLFALMATLMLTSCLNIVEEMTLKKDGTGSYTMTLDMGEMKSMLDMFKNMGGDDEEGDEDMPEYDEDGNPIEREVEDVVIDRSDEEEIMEEEEPMVEEDAEDANPAKMGEEFANMAETLKNVKGLTNVVAINDTANFKFGYSFDFQDIASLNKGLELVNKEKFDAKAEEVFSTKRKKFSRSGAANFGEEMKRALSEGDEEMGESMDMMKMFFGDMKYTQIYHFERKIKKSSNKKSEISDDGHTLTISLKPFADDDKNAGVATDVKLK